MKRCFYILIFAVLWISSCGTTAVTTGLYSTVKVKAEVLNCAVSDFVLAFEDDRNFHGTIFILSESSVFYDGLKIKEKMVLVGTRTYGEKIITAPVYMPEDEFNCYLEDLDAFYALLDSKHVR